MPRAICVKCKHHKGPRRGGIWYEHFCKAVTRPLGIDPVTGINSYYSQNDLGRVSFGADKHPNCRDVNTDGECGDFKGH